MIEASAFKDAGAYIRQQEQTLSQIPPDQLGSFVLPSIERLAVEYVEPIAHAASPAIPETEVAWLDSELRNGGHNIMVNPQLGGLLPARCSTISYNYRFHGLLLPMDGSFLKIQTIADGQAAKNRISMEIVSLSFASEVEVEDFVVASTRAGITAEPETTLIKPRQNVNYDRQIIEKSEKVLVCTYTNYDNWDERQELYSHTPTHERDEPQRLTVLHQHFMRGARTALAGLRSVLG